MPHLQPGSCEHFTKDLQFSLINQALYATGRGTFQDSNPLANVTIMGVDESVSHVTLNGIQLASGWAWNGTSQVLEIKELMNSTSSGAWSSDWVLRWE